MRKRKIVWIPVLVLTAVAGVLCWKKYRQHSINPISTETDTAVLNTIRSPENFSGDDGVLLKGKLLDPCFKSAYENLPDTLVHLEFGDALYCASCALIARNPEIAVAVQTVAADEPAHTYSYFPEKTGLHKIDSVSKTTDPRFYNLLRYLKLAEAGKAGFPGFTLPVQSSGQGAMMDAGAFNSKYSSRFTPFYLARIPYPVKELLLDFFSSEEGKDFEFITADQRDHAALVRLGSFTGKDKEELVCVVGTKENAQSNHKEKILVFAINAQDNVYMLYKEDFYDKVLLETVYPDPEDRWDATVYQDTEEKKSLSFDGIRIKLPGQPDIVLAYNPTFDKMNRYVQLPYSKIHTANEDDQ